MDLMNGYYNIKSRPANTNQLGALPALAALPKIAGSVVSGVKKVVRFLKGVIKNDNGIVAARDLWTAYVLGRFANYSGSRAWSSKNKTAIDITKPIIDYFRIDNDDIPNVKVGGNYDAELERVTQAMAAYLTLYEPDKLQPFYDALPTLPKPDHAFLEVTTGKAGPWSRETLLNLPAFSMSQINAMLKHAESIALETIQKPSAPSSSSNAYLPSTSIPSSGNDLTTVYSSGSTELLPPPPPEKKTASAGLILGIGAAAIAFGALATMPKPKPKGKLSGTKRKTTKRKKRKS